jgi:hypothetical protein
MSLLSTLNPLCLDIGSRLRLVNWTISCNGTERLLADWGITQVKRSLVSQGQDTLTFKADGASCDSAPLFVPYGPWVTLYRNRTQNSDGTFSGGNTWFQGVVTQVPRTGAPDSESMLYKVAGPWWYLEHIVFQQPYQNIFLGYATPGDPATTPLYGQANSSHLFLNQGLSGSALLKITTGQQIIEALNWALKPFTGADATPPFQIGSVTPAVDVPIDEVRDITCAEVVHKMLRWSPDAVTYFDYTTTPPTFNCIRRTDMTATNLDVSKT